MNELLITIMLVVPAPNKMVDWNINEVPTQIQLVHEDGTEVSYNATAVPCKYKPRSINEMVFASPQAYAETVVILSLICQDLCLYGILTTGIRYNYLTNLKTWII